MSAVGIWLLQNALIATVVAALLLVIVRVARPRPALEHLLWLLVAIKFVLPPLAVLTLPAQVVDPVAELAPKLTGAVAPGDAFVQAPAPVPSTNASASASDEPESAATRTRSALPFSPSTIAQLLVAVWLLAAFASATWRLTRHRFWMRRVARTAEPAPAELHDVVAECAHDLRIAAPSVFVSPGAPTPLVTGLRRPVLYWPVELLGTLGAERTRTIVMHELAHLRRRDLWTGMIELMVDCLWRWYPGWRMVRRRLRDAAERACDAVVVESDPHSRRQYAEAILDVLSLGARRRQGALSLGVDGPGPLELRIHRILQPDASRGSRAVGYASLALVALAILPWWRGSATPLLEPMRAAAPVVETRRPVVSYDVESVTSRGVVGWNGRKLDLEPNAWLIAFDKTGGSSHRVEARRSRDGETTVRWIVDGREARFDANAAQWLDGVIDRRGWNPARTRTGEVKSASGGSGTFLNWMNDRVETMSYWSTSDRGLRRDGSLDSAADLAHPVYIIHQADENAPVEFMALASDGDRLRVLKRSVDARPASTDTEGEAAARRVMRRMAEWMY